MSNINDLELENEIEKAIKLLLQRQQEAEQARIAAKEARIAAENARIAAKNAENAEKDAKKARDAAQKELEKMFAENSSQNVSSDEGSSSVANSSPIQENIRWGDLDSDEESQTSQQNQLSSREPSDTEFRSVKIGQKEPKQISGYLEQRPDLEVIYKMDLQEGIDKLLNECQDFMENSSDENEFFTNSQSDDDKRKVFLDSNKNDSTMPFVKEVLEYWNKLTPEQKNLFLRELRLHENKSFIHTKILPRIKSFTKNSKSKAAIFLQQSDVTFRVYTKPDVDPQEVFDEIVLHFVKPTIQSLVFLCKPNRILEQLRDVQRIDV